MRGKNSVKKYWIKTLLHKDNTPQWDGAVGEEAAAAKMEELRSQGYTPYIDHSMTEDV
jgi:hypothetical protein